MAGVEELVGTMRRNPRAIRFRELCRVCDFYFGTARQSSSSHRIYPTPWEGDPRINIQNDRGKAKTYQVKQVLIAIERLEQSHATEE